MYEFNESLSGVTPMREARSQLVHQLGKMSLSFVWIYRSSALPRRLRSRFEPSGPFQDTVVWRTKTVRAQTVR